MTPADIQQEVERIRALIWDAEAAHAAEDALHYNVLKAIAEGRCTNPADAAHAALQTAQIEFDRWCG